MLKVEKDKIKNFYRACLSMACILVLYENCMEQPFAIGLIHLSLRHRKQEISEVGCRRFRCN